MNEQIEKIAERVGIHINKYGILAVDEDSADIEEFAELIIKECLKVMDQNWSDGHEVHQAMEDIKKHFGIQ